MEPILSIVVVLQLNVRLDCLILEFGVVIITIRIIVSKIIVYWLISSIINILLKFILIVLISCWLVVCLILVIVGLKLYSIMVINLLRLGLIRSIIIMVCVFFPTECHIGGIKGYNKLVLYIFSWLNWQLMVLWLWSLCSLIIVVIIALRLCIYNLWYLFIMD